MKNNNNITPEELLAKTKMMPNGCREWQGAKSHFGYGMISYHNKVTTAQRLMLILLYGLPEVKSYAMHLCDNPPCINPDHLKWGTPKENTKDMMRKNRQRLNPNYGEKHHNAKLTREAVEFIRANYGAEWSALDLAKKFGVGKTTIFNVVYYRIWK